MKAGNAMVAARPAIQRVNRGTINNYPLSAIRWAAIAAIAGIANSAFGLFPQTPEPVAPSVAAASDEGRIAMQQFRIPTGWEKHLFVAEPDVANIVAFTIDHRGRFFVCETFRQEQGVTDNRSHDQNWLEHDLAAQTVQDRIDYHRKLLPDADVGYTRQDDRIRLVEDVDGDGVADRSTVFADHFNRLEDGTGAGVLNVGDSVWYTNIPELWRLRDSNGDGTADERESLQTGFGVRVAFRGHDMHGLVMGPDGRVYFSIGDRGYHLELPDGQILSDPDSGAVFRCEADGTGLEVFATGLRNPQELAFDQFGNLFTGDNNSDSGDRARWVYVIHGSDSGWRMHYQYLPDRGPFNREKIWHPYHREQPAYIVPPVDNLGDGPSGLVYYPGTGVGEGLTDCFLMCDFRGTGVTSGIRAFKSVPEGAFFKLVEQPSPVWQILATDLAIGPDGWLYVSDWVDGWVGEGKGRIYRFGDPAVVHGAAAKETARLLNDGFAEREVMELVALLGHADMRIRQGTQFELVKRNAIDELCTAATSGPDLQARIHGIWGAGQYYRQRKVAANAVWMRKLLFDDELEIRAAMARVAGDLTAEAFAEDLVKLLGDHSARVRAMAAISLGQLRYRPASDALIKVLEENNDVDPALRHAAIMGLVGCGNEEAIELMMVHESVAVRRGLAVILRSLRDDRIASLLQDDDVLVAEEAARGIFDEEMPAAYYDLVNACALHSGSNSIMIRAIQAARILNLRTTASLTAVISCNSGASIEIRVQALKTLANWGEQQTLDPVNGKWSPLRPGRAADVESVLGGVIEVSLLQDSDQILIAFFELVAKLSVQEERNSVLESILTREGRTNSWRANLISSMSDVALDRSRSNELRVATIRSLMAANWNVPQNVVRKLLKDPSAGIRSATLQLLVRNYPDFGVGALSSALESNDVLEQQIAVRLLPDLARSDASRMANRLVAPFLARKVPNEIRLDILTALQQLGAGDESIRRIVNEYQAEEDSDSDPKARWRDSLYGGDPMAGRKLFYEKTALSCLRCHHVGEDGGNVGPNLSDVGARKDRQYLLESILLPNREITEKFGSVVILTDSGETVSGILHAETKDFVRLVRADGDMVTVDTAAIVDRRTGKSAMPEDVVQHLTPHEMRDLIEFLASLKQPPSENVPESLEIK